MVLGLVMEREDLELILGRETLELFLDEKLWSSFWTRSFGAHSGREALELIL